MGDAIITGPGRYVTADGGEAWVHRVDADMAPYPARGFVRPKGSKQKYRAAWTLEGRECSTCPRGSGYHIVAAEARRR